MLNDFEDKNIESTSINVEDISIREEQSFSMLYPYGKNLFNSNIIDEEVFRDFKMDVVVNLFGLDKRNSEFVKSIMSNICMDTGTIQYRQEIIEDLLTYPGIKDSFEKLLPNIETLEWYNYSNVMKKDPTKSDFYSVMWRLDELEQYIVCIKELGKVFSKRGTNLKSKGLIYLKNLVYNTENDKLFINLEKELPEVLEKKRSISSVTVGINLDARLHPSEATLISVNDKKFKGNSFINSIFGKSEFEGIGLTKLHSNIRKDKFEEVNPSLNLLMEDLGKAMKGVSNNVSKFLERYVKINSKILSNLRKEIIFYIGAVTMVKKLLENRLPVCKPEILKKEDRVFYIENNYNINLLSKNVSRRSNQKSSVVYNNVEMTKDKGSVFIVTGPNSGGKTTYLEAIGITQLLAQSGLFVPGLNAKISLVDNIYTHFQVEEKVEIAEGRLGEESNRLNKIFDKMTKYSMVFLNETFSSTSEVDSFYIAKDILKIFSITGVKSIFVTHLHDLADEVDDINEKINGETKIRSMVANITKKDGKVVPTYEIKEGKPLGKSYAEVVAKGYGISYDQIFKKLKTRGIIREKNEK